MALSYAVPYFPRPIGDFNKARSSGFSVSWSPGEQALMQRISSSWASNQNDFLQNLLDNLNDEEKALLQTITVSWKAQEKAFMQGLLEELSEEEKAALQRFSISIGKQQKAKEQQMTDLSDIYRRLGLPTSDEAKAEGLKPTDFFSLVGDLSNNVANRINRNNDAGKPSLGATDFLGLVSDLANKVSDRLDSNGGGKAEEQDFGFGDALKLFTAVAPIVAGK